jgi:glycosyltransferase involved in cell wall biosynthesis
MRILLCNYEYPPLGGGGGVVTGFLAGELARRHAVTVLTSGALGLPRDTVEPGGVRVVRVPVPFRRHTAVATVPSMLAFVARALEAGSRLVGRDGYDIVNTHFVLPTGPVGDRLAHASGIPNVLSLHGGDLYDPSKRLSPHRHAILRVWIRRLLRRADAVVGQSENTINNMRRFYTCDVPATRIPLGIPRPLVHAGSRRRFGCHDHEVLLLTIGRLVARKAVHQLIAMMERFRGQPVRLLIVGSGPAADALRAEVGRRALDEHVRLLGQLSEAEKFEVLTIADAYVSTSQHEGFGLVFLEAMARGLPVVAYDHGGQSDFLRDTETGFVVPLNDLDRFTDRCRRLVESRTLRRALGARARAVAEELYIDRCAALYEATFCRALSAHGTTGRPDHERVA